MKRVFSGFVGAFALLGTQAAASEAYVVPDASSSWILTGTMVIDKGIALTCNVTIELNGPNDAADIAPPYDHTDASNLSASITFSGGVLGLCASLIVDPIGWGNVTYTSTGSSSGVLTFHNVFLTTTTPGNCAGSLGFAWNEASPPALTITGRLPAISGLDCKISGTAELASPIDGNIVGVVDGDHKPNHP